jgi:hypothetical protein
MGFAAWLLGSRRPSWLKLRVAMAHTAVSRLATMSRIFFLPAKLSRDAVLEIASR